MPNKRLLILNPWVPCPVSGACQQDRWNGYRQFKEMGYDIHVLARIHSFQDRAKAEQMFRESQIPLTLVPHNRRPWMSLLKALPKALTNLAYLDGAALEYMETGYQKTVMETVESFKPDVIWIEYTSLWPLLRLLKPTGIPIVMKSSLNEPRNCIDEHGGDLISRIKAIPKYFSERIAAQESKMLLAITPDEEQWYKSLGAKNTGVLPLRGLSRCLTERTHQQKNILDVVLLSSNYNMGHNRDAAKLLLTQIVPAVRRALPGKVRFHLTGSKFPESWKQYLADDVRHTGFVPDIGAFLRTMDAALCPWISGQGMQQKVFEPLCRSLPLLTTKTAGYPFENKKDVLFCSTVDEYVTGLQELFDANRRNELASNAYAKAKRLFSEDALKKVMESAITVASSGAPADTK